jgi:hypothetical protein
MTELTANNVKLVLTLCLSAGHYDPTAEWVVTIEAVRNTYCFVRPALEAQRATIDMLLSQLPQPFRALGYGDNPGGGWSFLNACETATGEHWGEHPDIENLLALGLAIGSVTWSLPRDMWEILPGQMPYFQIEAPKAQYNLL